MFRVQSAQKASPIAEVKLPRLRPACLYLA
jgi:hypothetical protein